MLIVCRERGVLTALLESVLRGDGYAWTRVGPPLDEATTAFDDPRESAAADWIAKRRSRDPDLWVVELDIADSERFAAQITDAG